MKVFLLVFCCLFSVALYGQDMNFSIKGQITNQDNGKKEPGIVVTVIKNGQTMGTATTASNGKYEINFSTAPQAVFKIVYSKNGFVSKTITIDGTKFNEEDSPAGSNFPVPVLDMDMFADRPNTDFSFLNSEPVAAFFWDEKRMGINYDKSSSDKTKKKIADLLAKAENEEAQNEAKYNAAIKIADGNYSQKKYELALSKYEEAIGYKPQDEYANKKIAEIDALLKAQKEEDLKSAQLEEAYMNLIKAGDNLNQQKKYEEAIAKYQEALTKKDENYPKDQITKLEKLIEDQKNNTAKQAEFDALVAKGEANENAKKLEDAKTNYEQAFQLIADPKVKAKIDALTKTIALNKANADKLAQYDALMTSANDLLNSEKLNEAKAKYIEASKLIPTEQEPKDKIKTIDDLLANKAADKLKKDKYNALIVSADQLEKGNKLAEAKLKYEEALKVDDSKTLPKEKIAELEKRIAENASQAELKTKIDKLIVDGTAALGKNELESAKSKFEEVLTLDAGNAVAKTKLAEVNQKIVAQTAQAELDAKFETLKSEGMSLANAKDWEAAKGKLNEALALKQDADVKKKITEIDAEIAKGGQYATIMSAANQLYSTEKLAEAKAKYQEASKLDPSQNEPKEKIADIDTKLAAIAANKAKIDKLIIDGTAALSKNELESAKSKFEEVLVLEAGNSIAKTKLAEVNQKIAAQSSQAELDAKFEALKSEGMSLANAKDWEAAKGKLNEALTLKQDADVKKKITEIDAEIAKGGQYATIMSAANQLYSTEKLAEAKAKYQEASKLDPSQNEPKEKIADIDTKLAAIAADKAKIDKLIIDGTAALSKNELESAKSKFEEVLVLEAGNSIAKTKLAEVNQKIAAQSSQAELDAKFEVLKSEGMALANAKDWEAAKGKLNEALTIKQDADVKKKITEIDAEIAKGGQYAMIMSAANQLYSTEKLAEAKAKYQEASKLDPSQNEPKEKIADIDTKLAAIAANKAKIDKLIIDGTAALSKNELESAKSKFEEVLVLEAGNSIAKTKLAEVNQKIAAQSSQAELDAKFEVLKSEGMALANAKDWEAAKGKLNEALTIKQDADVKKKITEIDAEIAKGGQYAMIMSAANQLYSTEKLAEAKAKYQEASKLDPSQNEPKEKIADIDTKLAAIAANKAKIDKLIIDGTAALSKNELESAKSKFEEVLVLEAGNSIAKTKLAEVNQKIAAQSSQAELDAKFEVLKSEGMALANAKDWEAAKGKLNEALTIKQDADVKKKIAEIEIEIKKEALLQNSEDAYTNLLKEASTLLENKNYDGAIAKYKEASLKKPEDKLPKDKIAEIEQLKKVQANQVIVDAKYKALMDAGKKLMVEKKYLDAIKKFNEALVVKPNEQEPVTKAKEAEQLAKEEKGGVDEQYEKILTVATKKMNEKDYVKAKELIDRAIKFQPNDPRPKKLLSELEVLQQKEKGYKLKLAEGEKAMNAKDYVKAKVAYEQASTIFPDETLPKEKITQLESLIAQKNADSENALLYTNHIKEGDKLFKEKKYQLALTAYEGALAVIPSDPIATRKIDEVKQIIAHEAKNGTVEENRTKFDAYIAEGDKFFRTQNYLEAKKSYESALFIIGDDSYAIQQAKESERLERERSGKQAEREYRKLINAADSKFANKDYDKAIEYYTRAISFKSNDPYPKQKLEEIDNVLNPKPITVQVEPSGKLDPLGEVIENSILDGQALLSQAELDRKNEKNKLVATGQVSASDKLNELTEKKSDDIDNTTNEILKVKNSISERNIDEIDRLRESNQILKEEVKDVSDVQSELEQFDHKENVNSQERLTQFTNEVALEDKSDNRKESAEKLKEKEVEVDALNSEFADKNTENSYDANYKVNEFNRQNEIDFIAKDENRLENVELIKEEEKEIIAFDKANNDKNLANAYDATDKVDELNKEIESININNEDNRKETAESLKEEEKEIIAFDKANNDKNLANAYDATDKVDELNKEIESININNEDNRKETAESLKEEEKEIIAFDKANNEKNLANAYDATDKVDELNKEIESLNINNEDNRKETAESLKEEEKEIIAFDKANNDKNLANAYDATDKVDELNKEIESINIDNEDNRKETAESLKEEEKEIIGFDKANNDKNLANAYDATDKVDELNKEIESININNEDNRKETAESLKEEEKEIIAFDKANNDKNLANAYDATDKVDELNKEIESLNINNEDNRKETAESLKEEEKEIIAFDKANNDKNLANAYDATDKVDELNKEIESLNINNEDNRKETAESLKEEEKEIIGFDKANNDKNLTNAYEATQKVDDLNIELSKIDIENEANRKENTESLKIKEKEINAGSEERTYANGSRINEVQTNVNELNKEVESLAKDNKEIRDESNDKLREASLSLMQSENETYNNEMVKYLANKDAIDEEINNQVGTTEKEKEKSAIIIEATKTKAKDLQEEEVQRRELSTNQIYESNAILQDQQDVSESKANESKDKQALNNEKIKSLNNNLVTEETEKNSMQKDKQQNSQVILDSKNNDVKPRVLAPNAIGKEYPEGVSQETFAQKDSKGLMTTILTRRIVVVDGHGDVYVRTQTVNSITYTKNGESCTEFVWRQETQGPQLIKNY
jgi:epidermal growth factor receptor substrate 15